MYFSHWQHQRMIKKFSVSIPMKNFVMGLKKYWVDIGNWSLIYGLLVWIWTIIVFFFFLNGLCLWYFCVPFTLSGPTSFAPVIEMAITIVEQSHGQYHVLLIIADGQVLLVDLYHIAVYRTPDLVAHIDKLYMILKFLVPLNRCKRKISALNSKSARFQEIIYFSFNSKLFEHLFKVFQI